MNNHKELLKHCVGVVDTFDPQTKAIEVHVNQYLKYNRVADDDEQTFVTEVFSGCMRYSSVLEVVMKGFFNQDGKHILRSEGNLYRVITYIALFRLDELGIAHFRHFVRSQDLNKMYRFLNFFLEEKHLLTWMKDEWTKLYDLPFVQTTLLSPLLQWHPELQDIVQHLRAQIDNKLKPRRQQIQATETKPFNLTQPRPRSIPIPKPIPRLKQHRPVPNTTYIEPKQHDDLSQIREINRRKAEEQLMLASKTQFACANPEKSEKTRSRLNTIITEQEGLLNFESHKSNPVPHSMLSDNIPIKLNTAAILREGNLYTKRERQELEKLERLEAGSRDTSQFLDWQSRMRQKDTDVQLAEIEQRRLEGKLSHEEAILARQNLVSENKLRVQMMKEEAGRLMQEYMERRLLEEDEMKAVVQGVQNTHENAKESKKKMQEFKAKIVQEINEESRALMKQALEEAEQEMRQKMELIRQIRAVEAVPVIRQKLVDLTDTAGHGLLSEMSIAELRERLSLHRVTGLEEEEERRDSILATKQAKDQILMDTLESISRHRTEQSKAAAVKLEERKKYHDTRPVIQAPHLSELQQRLEEKRAERKVAQQKMKIKPDKKSTQRLRELNASKKMLEESRWQEMEQRQQRTAKMASAGIEGSRSAAKIAARPIMAS